METKKIFVGATILDITVDEWGNWTELTVLCKDGEQRILVAADGEFFVEHSATKEEDGG